MRRIAGAYRQQQRHEQQSEQRERREILVRIGWVWLVAPLMAAAFVLTAFVRDEGWNAMSMLAIPLGPAVVSLYILVRDWPRAPR